MQRNSGHLVGLCRQIYFLRSRIQKSRIVPEVILQLALFARRKRRCDNLTTAYQHDLAARYQGKLLRNRRIHLISDGKRSELFDVASRAGRHRTYEHPIQLIVRVPPRSVLILFDRSRKILLNVRAIQS